MDVKRLRELNFQHLLYFFVVAREGSLAKAGAVLHVTQPTLSTQISQLERRLGQKLFQRVGRGLELTTFGRRVLGWAQEVFSVSEAMLDGIRHDRDAGTRRFVVGVVDSFPKLLSHRFLESLLEGAEAVLLECRENKQPELLAQLALHRIDVVLSTSPVSAESGVRAYNHRLGSSSVGIFASPPLAEGLGRAFPESLEEAPWVLQSVGTPIRSAVDQWFDRRGLRPRVVAEMDDGALMKAFASHASGVCACPTIEADEVSRQYRLELIGVLDTRPEHFYLISSARRLNDPLTQRLADGARRHFEMERGDT